MLMAARERALIIRHSAGAAVRGDLLQPPSARGLVVFAAGPGTGRLNPENRLLAETLNRHGLAVCLIDLLTPEEQKVDRCTQDYRFDVGLLSDRLVGAVDALERDLDVPDVPIGLFAEGSFAAAALVAAARRPRAVRAVVSRAGRPDLVPEWLNPVHAPTLLLAGEDDPQVLSMNATAADHLTGEVEVRLQVVTGAGRRLHEPDAIESVSDLTAEWFVRHLARESAGHFGAAVAGR